MPTKGGQLTIQETDFVRLCADLGDPTKAAELAGYTRPGETATRMSHRAEVQAAVQAATLAKLRVHGMTIGVKTLIDIAGDEKAPKAPRVQAASKLVELNREANAGGSGSTLSEMSRAELDEARARALAYLRSLDAPPVLELSPEPVDTGAAVGHSGVTKSPGLFD